MSKGALALTSYQIKLMLSEVPVKCAHEGLILHEIQVVTCISLCALYEITACTVYEWLILGAQGCQI